MTPTVGGVEIRIKPSLLLMGGALVLVFADRFGQRTDTNPYVLATGFVVGLYVSVLVHELAHVAAARAYGMRVESVTLHLLGGETAIAGESRRPAQELWIAIVGPLTSAAIGLVCFALADDGLVRAIGLVNLLVAAFNMIPGLPLDGGRVLRAVIWAITGREVVGIRVAGWIGRAAAVAVLVWAILRPRDDSFVIDLVVALLVAWFLWAGSGQALHDAERRTRVNSLVARDLADPGAPVPPGAVALDADLHGHQLLRTIAARPADAYVLTESDGTVVGVLTLDALDDAYRRSR